MSARELWSLRGQFDQLVRQVKEERQKMVTALQRQAEKHSTQVVRASARVDARAQQLEELKTDVARLAVAVHKHSAQNRRVKKLIASQIGQKPLVLERLERIAAGNRPILVGPWTGEVGYEVLYWIPFVRWFVQRYGVDPGRVCVISRGGPVSWYEGLGSRYVDALSFLSADDFRRHPGRLAWMKQDRVGALDYQIVRRVRETIGSGRISLLHPLLMFRLFKGYWGGRMSLDEVLSLTSHRRLALPEPLPGLPAKYVAARFYFRSSFPDTPANRAFVSRTLAALAAHSDVVLLSAGVQIDDHRDYTGDARRRVHTIDHLLTPERNLDVQTAVIARAEAFVGSYGGFAYLAPLLGVPSVSFYSVNSFKACHLELAEHVFERVDGAGLNVLSTDDVSGLERTLPEAERQLAATGGT